MRTARELYALSRHARFVLHYLDRIPPNLRPGTDLDVRRLVVDSADELRDHAEIEAGKSSRRAGQIGKLLLGLIPLTIFIIGHVLGGLAAIWVDIVVGTFVLGAVSAVRGVIPNLRTKRLGRAIVPLPGYERDIRLARESARLLFSQQVGTAVRMHQCFRAASQELRIVAGAVISLNTPVRLDCARRPTDLGRTLATVPTRLVTASVFLEAQQAKLEKQAAQAQEPGRRCHRCQNPATGIAIDRASRVLSGACADHGGESISEAERQ